MYPYEGCYDRGTKTNPHDPYGVGYRRATRVIIQSDAISKEGAKH